MTEPDNVNEVPVYKDKLHHYVYDELPAVELAYKIGDLIDPRVKKISAAATAPF